MEKFTLDNQKPSKIKNLNTLVDDNKFGDDENFSKIPVNILRSEL